MNARKQDAKPAAGPGTPPVAVPVSVDFANVSGGRLLVYGWVLGLSKQMARAEIRFGDALVDLMSVGVPVARPDIAKHFPAQVDPSDVAHGFYLNVALPEVPATLGLLRVSVWKKSGEQSDSTWPVSAGEAAAAFFFGQHRTTLDSLLTSLRAADANRLRALAGMVVDAPAPAAETQLHFGLDACHLLGRILVVLGWLDAGEAPLTAVGINLGELTLDGLPDIKIGPPPDKPAGTTLRGESRYLSPFTWVGLLPEAAVGCTEATVELGVGSRLGSARHLLSRYGHLGLADSLQSLDPDQALSLLERISAAKVSDSDRRPAWLQESFARSVERLPLSLLMARPRLALHCEGLTPVAPHGLYFTGWFDAEPGTVSQVACHDGRRNVRIDGTWERLHRPDVAEHLKASGLGGEEDHGFLCYVAFDEPSTTYYVSVTLSDGVVRRMRLPALPPLSNALPSIRSILTSFALPHRRLRTLLDRHIGPAVRSAWTRRAANTHPVSSQRFGSSPSRPAVSVIVPLYGRFDFAEYQMALFADDADFQSTELIYFVDDPSIFDAFQAQCADLYGTYRVPFTLVFAGANLGFAGANNVAAAVARGEYLVLLNSDVLPKAPGWLSDMLATFGALKNPGLLGVKLLYEDGSVQHAGMTFRRHAAWGGMRINEHPEKGLSAQGLTGLRQVPAVTAACAMVDARLYRELGGLSEDYIIGDFEDSDFCLRAAAAGRRNYVALDIELYHLERQSQARIGDARWRTNLTLYNCWLHHTRWAAQIEKMQR